MREAQEANRAKSDFLANMSHELRTPLNAVIGFSEMMHGEVFGPLGHPKYKDYNLDIFNSATHLLAIIQDILDLSKIESSRYEIAPEKTDVRDVARWVSTLCANQPRTAHRDAMDVNIDAEFGLIMADPRAFRQILLNLVNNAYKFTPESGKIGIEGRVLETGEPAISVWDTGIGIPADKLDHVRKPFHQVEGAFQRKFQGTGLGLSISEALVKLHGGRLLLESELGRGTRVTVVFPANAHFPQLSHGVPMAAAE
jgi:two-component system cell cycle sensor histidine kinase PleC